MFHGIWEKYEILLITRAQKFEKSDQAPLVYTQKMILQNSTPVGKLNIKIA